MLRRIAYVRRNRCSALVAALTFFILLNPLLAISAIGGSMLGVALFARTPRAVTLTEAGSDYFARVEVVLRALAPGLDWLTKLVR